MDTIRFPEMKWIMGCLILLGSLGISVAEEPCEWSYQPPTGPEAWPRICRPHCAGTQQSPIDISLMKLVGAPASQPRPKIYYEQTEMIIYNTGRTIQAEDQKKINRLVLGEKTYTLVQIHFHAKSEHTLDGNHRPLEMHLVHRYNDTDLAVIGILIVAGTENAAFAPLWNPLPATPETPRRDLTINPGDLLPAQRGSFRYDGSLTTPNCDEIVTWFVLPSPVQMSAEQIAAFTAIFPNNFRPVQPLNGRKVYAIP